jgi:hypothetical protein
MSEICGSQHPEVEGIICAATTFNHPLHCKVVSWKERYDWPNEEFVAPSNPSSLDERRQISSGMRQMAVKVDESHSYLRFNPHVTEVMAADVSAVRSSRRRKQVLHVIARAMPNGVTDDEIAVVLESVGLTMNTTRPRRLELQEFGWVKVMVEEGREIYRPTQTGSLARVWILTESGESALSLVDFSETDPV